MKKLFLCSALAIAAYCKSFAYTTITVKDSISTNTTWSCDKQYLLKGYVYVTAGATLTIEPGTIIKGDKDTKGALIIERGAKIMAVGTASQPIVFTSNIEPGSRTYGDWGGVILCGKSLVNWTAGQAQVEGGPRSFYGGTDIHDNSGTMQYVRIEFGGVAFSPNNEVNSLTFCGVGDGTTIDHIQASYGGDDAFEFFGGTVNTHHMVSYRTWDDDFDTDNGYQGKNQFLAVIRDPYSADLSGSKAFESDSYLGGTYSGIPADNTKMNRSIFSNCTIIGPLVSPTSTAFDPNFVAGAHLRRGSGMSILNSVFAGWPAGLLIDESSSAYGSTVANIMTNELQFRNNIICGSPVFPSTTTRKDVFFVKDGARSLTPTTTMGDTTSTGTDWSTLTGFSGPVAFLNNPSFKNKTYASMSGSVFLGNPFNLSNPNLVPNSTSPICFNSAHPFNPNLPLNYDTTSSYANYNVPAVPPEFTTSKASDAFFTKVNYVGAFAGTGKTSDNWMRGWTNFDPVNENYDLTCYVAPDPSSVATVNADANFSARVFPNPANTVATVLVDVTTDGAMTITLSDMTGKKVKEIMNGEVRSGEQTFSFSTTDLSSGLYIININTENKQKSLKISVIK